jgi:hypothetical protein
VVGFGSMALIGRTELLTDRTSRGTDPPSTSGGGDPLVVRTGPQWRDLLAEFPAWRTSGGVDLWSTDGTCDRILAQTRGWA